MQRLQEEAKGEAQTVLVVDDNADDLRLAQHVVAGVCPNAMIHGVKSADEMFIYVKGEQGYTDRKTFPYPSLILLDLSMPHIHGFEVLKWLKSHPPHDRIPVVVLTASGEMMLAQRSYELGASSFLTKPLKPAEFRDTLAKFPNWAMTPGASGGDRARG